MPTLIDSKGEYFAKRATEVLDYTIDWALKLGSDTISTSDWAVPTGITEVSDSKTTTTCTVKLSGGTAGSEYDCVNTIVTAGGMTQIQSLRVKVIPPAALSSSALITLAQFKSMAGLTDTVPDSDPLNDLYSSLIEAASTEIIGYCGRNFKVADYIEEIWTDEAQTGVILKEFPVVYIESLHDTLEDAILLTNTATNAVTARAWIASDRKLYLQVVGGTSNGITSIDLTLAANDTLTELIAAINLIGSGWAARLATGASGYDRSEYLVETSGTLVPSTGLYIKRLGTALSTPYFYESTNGILTVPVSGSRTQPSLWVKYRGGYTTIPSDLQLLTVRYALAMQGELGRDPTLESERIGDYSYTRAAASGSVLLALEGQLKNWKSRSV